MTNDTTNTSNSNTPTSFTTNSTTIIRNATLTSTSNIPTKPTFHIAFHATYLSSISF